METNFNGVTASSDIPQSVTNTENKKDNIFKRFYEWYQYQVPFKKIIILSIGIFVILIILAGLLYGFIIYKGYNNATKPAKVVNAPTPTPTPTPITKIDPLTGITYTGANVGNLNRPPLAVMIENSVPARPQTSWNQADIVYEALAEGGITRTMAVFLGNTPALVGPVRSARTYFLDFAQEYNAIFAHWGQNSDVIPSLSADNIRNVDAIVQSGTEQSCNAATGLFCRDNSRNAPDNGYGFPQRIWNYGASVGWSAPSNITSWTFKDDALVATRGIDKASLNITFMNGDNDYAVTWVYDKTNNIFNRYNGGTLQTDRADGTTITAKNIVVQFVNGVQYTSSGGKEVWGLTDVGTGKVSAFIDGNETDGTWKKDSATGRTTYADQNGSPIQFDKGRTWITVLVNNTGSFTYK